MTPTMKLRWKKVDSLYKSEPDIQNAYGFHHVLQQWWDEIKFDDEGHIARIYGEWRDIPIETEK